MKITIYPLPETKTPFFDALNMIQRDPKLLVECARRCSQHYDLYNGTTYHDDSLFILPVTDANRVAIKSNTLAIDAMLDYLQGQALQRNHTPEQMDQDIPRLIQQIYEFPDPLHDAEFMRHLHTQPLHIQTAKRVFGQYIDLCLGANTLWNNYQVQRDDKEGLGRVSRRNIFITLPLGEIIKDWQQVVVTARFLHEVLMLMEVASDAYDPRAAVHETSTMMQVPVQVPVDVTPAKEV